MRFVLIVLFILVPIAELAVLIQIGELIGVWWTIALLVADAILGSLLARSQGRTVWRRFNEAISAGRAPAREVMDGALVLFGGALLLTPGFVTDIFGLAFLLPPTRAVIRRLLTGTTDHGGGKQPRRLDVAVEAAGNLRGAALALPRFQRADDAARAVHLGDAAVARRTGARMRLAAGVAGDEIGLAE